MVSIPDWSKLGRLGEPVQEPQSISSRFQRQQAAEAIKQAEEHGYFLNASRSFIEQKFLTAEETKHGRYKSLLEEFELPEKDLTQLQMMKLIGARLRSVGDIGMCRCLTICILSNNYVTRFDALLTCSQLVKLDLHSNHITMVPPPAFWECLPELRILHLHDNPIGKIENLHYISASPSLTAMTLYDTPLSLKRNYRHHVVNSVWTLKTLDNLVISDEEIIEDADFGGIFAAMHPAFYVELCPPVPQEVGYHEEVEVVHCVLSEINRIMAHHSPVLIIQRYVRGYLTRRSYQLIKHARTCDRADGAAMTIQRTFREYKGIEQPSVTIPPPPSSPIAPEPPKPTTADEPPVSDAVKLDYDTYMKHRRPGSTTFSEVSHHSSQNRQSQSALSAPYNSASSEVGHKRKNIFINLAKLQSGALQSLQDEVNAMETAMGPSDGSMSLRDERSRQASRKTPRKREPEKHKRQMRTVKQFFGPVVEVAPSPEPDPTSEPMEEEDMPRISFRLRGFHQRVQYYDPTTSMILARREAGRQVRAAENEYHLQQEDLPQPKIRSKSMVSGEKRIFSRVQGTMGLSCLYAIKQAYKDREKAEKRSAKLDYVMGMREQREAGRDRIRAFQEQKRQQTLKNREQDHNQLLDMLDCRDRYHLQSMERSQEKRQYSSKASRIKRGQLTFVNDFSAQNTSVSNALLRHDRQARKEDFMHDKKDKVQDLKVREQDQASIVNKYLEHRQLMRQTESAMSRAALDTRMLQEANDRLIQARTRVSQQKARTTQVHNFYPLPTVSNHALPPVGVQQDMKGMDRWNTSLMVNQGRVGRHPTSVTM